MVYLYYMSCLRYTILVGNPRYRVEIHHSGWKPLICSAGEWELGVGQRDAYSFHILQTERREQDRPGMGGGGGGGGVQSFQPPYHFIVLPRAFHSIFFHLIVFFIEKNVLALVLKIAYSNTRTQAHSQAVVLLVVVLQVRIQLSSNTSGKANYGLCAETGKTAAAKVCFSVFTKSTELLTAAIFGRFAAVFFLTDRISVHF